MALHDKGLAREQKKSFTAFQGSIEGCFDKKDEGKTSWYVLYHFPLPRSNEPTHSYLSFARWSLRISKVSSSFTDHYITPIQLNKTRHLMRNPKDSQRNPLSQKNRSIAVPILDSHNGFQSNSPETVIISLRNVYLKSVSTTNDNSGRK